LLKWEQGSAFLAFLFERKIFFKLRAGFFIKIAKFFYRLFFRKGEYFMSISRRAFIKTTGIVTESAGVLGVSGILTVAEKRTRLGVFCFFI